MKKPTKQPRFGKVELTVIALVGALLILVGLLIVKNRSTPQETAPTTQQTDSIPKVTNTDGLSDIEKTLDDTSVDSGADSSQLDQELSGF